MRKIHSTPWTSMVYTEASGLPMLPSSSISSRFTRTSPDLLIHSHLCRMPVSTLSDIPNLRVSLKAMLSQPKSGEKQSRANLQPIHASDMQCDVRLAPYLGSKVGVLSLRRRTIFSFSSILRGAGKLASTSCATETYTGILRHAGRLTSAFSTK